MSAPTEQQKLATPESPTTARPLELDDDDFQDSTLNADDAAKPATTTATTPAAGAAGAAAEGEERAPPMPPRPVTQQQKNEQTLKEAFPTVEMPVIKAVLTASRGNVEDAFHALLEMTDPSAVEEDDNLPAPPQPPRPARQEPVPPAGNLSPHSQMLADEEYARQLAQHYENEGAYEARTSGSGYGERRGYPSTRRNQETGLKPNEMWGDNDHSFIDDDLPVIRENLRKGFVETQTKFNTWFAGIKKRIDDEWNNDDDDDEQPRPAQPPRPSAGRSGYGRGGFGAQQQPPRRSGDYDADPQVLSDDFAGIQLHGDGTPVRPGNQNPNLFRPPPSSSPRTSADRKVAFREGEEVIDVYNASPRTATAKESGSGAGADSAAAASGAKASKWQPLSSVDPTPIGDSDPFSLGDSEDEKDTAVKTTAGTASTTTTAAAGAASASKADDKPAAATEGAAAVSSDDAERLRKAAAEAMADSLVEDKPKA